MEYEHMDVRLSRIAADDATFRISTHSSASALVDSIQKIGLMNRPSLFLQNGWYIIVSGFARVQASRLLGWNQVPARCLDPQTPMTVRALIAIADNSAQRPLNIVEQARSFHLLSRAFENQDVLLEAAQSAGLDINPDLTRKLSTVHQMSDQLQQGLLDGTIALPIALRLKSMAATESAEALGHFFRELDLSLNRQRELLDWIEAIAHREQKAIADILSDRQLAQWLRDQEMDRPRKSQLIRQYLKLRRFPTLSHVEQRYVDAVKKMSIEKGVQLIPPPHFEGQTFSIQMDFCSQDDLNQRLNEIQRLKKTAAFQELLNQRFID